MFLVIKTLFQTYFFYSLENQGFWVKI